MASFPHRRGNLYGIRKYRSLTDVGGEEHPLDTSILNGKGFLSTRLEENVAVKV